MANVPVGAWAVRTVRFEPLGRGRFALVVSGSRIVFDPVDPVRFDTEARAVTLSNELAEAATPAGRAVSLAPRPVAPERESDQPRNPGLAALLSVAWAGAGQFYNGNLSLAVLFTLIQVMNVVLFQVGVGYVGFVVVAVAAAVQAFREADRTAFGPRLS